MPKPETIYVLDRDVRRRASIAGVALGLGHHAELYDGLKELAIRPPSSGLLLVSDDNLEPILPKVFEIIEGCGGYLPVAMYSHKISPKRIVAAMHLGALDYLRWPFNPKSFQGSLKRLEKTGRALEGKRRELVRARLLVQQLSNRERQVLSALVNGSSSKNIGAVLGISPRTVEIHRANLVKKLDASSTVDAIRIGLLAGEDDDQPIGLRYLTWTDTT